MNMTEVKTAELVGLALSWAFLTASYGDGPDWSVKDGVFGVVYLKDAASGLDGVSQVEDFQAYDPESLYGVDECRHVVMAKLGEVISVPSELVEASK